MKIRLFHGRSKEPEAERVLPAHIAIIMDGNGRWAKRRGLPRSAGHTAGAAAFRSLALYCNRIGLRYLTVYAFSTENWKRPPAEVSAIMDLLREYLRDSLARFKGENIRTRFIGDKAPLADDLKALIRETEEGSRGATGLTLNIALNYGGRQEITAAARELAGRAAAGRLRPEDIDESMMAGLMDTAGQPDPDLIIRPSGEQRISNFLLWQSAYSEYWFSDVLWPDFGPKVLERAIDDYNRRERRYGGI